MSDFVTYPAVAPVGDREVNVIWAPDDIVGGALLSRCEAMLAESERRRYSSLRSEEGRRRFLIARALTRHVLSLNCGMAPEDLVFGANRWGKPFLLYPEDSGLAFNIAHTKGMVAIAVARANAIGVDVERVLPREENVEIAERLFSVRENEALRTLPPMLRAERFYDYWTLKEAYVKGRGLGLSLPFDRFAIVFGERPCIAARPDIDDGRQWQLDLRSLEGGYRLAIAIDLPNATGSFGIRLSQALPEKV